MKILINILPIHEILFAMQLMIIRMQLTDYLKESADFAIVVGGYNSSNTSHIVENCVKKKLHTYFISAEENKF